MPENNFERYRRAYLLLMAACNNVLDLLPNRPDTAAAVLQNAALQAEEIFLCDFESCP